MEILRKFKDDGYFTAHLYHLITKKKLVDKFEEIVPSVYEKEMRMSTTARLQNLNAIEIDNLVSSGKTPSKVVLSFTPRIIVFQNFKPNDHIVAKFSVKNISKSPTFLNMVFKESSYFFIKPCGAQLLSRLAPGISVSFAITFMPVQYEDYTHRVNFYTDVDQYILPLIAMGPRPIFDFPDEVIIPTIPLKVESFYLMSIHNVGLVPSGFTLNTKCPFSVYPKSAYLQPNEKIEIKCSFKTMRLGMTRGVLVASFETGENFRIELSGTTHTVSIELEKQVVRFLDTFNTMVRQQTFKIINKSEHLITYMCMKNESVAEDFEDKLKMAKLFYELKESESLKNTKLVQYDVLSSDEHERVYTRIFMDEIQSLVADQSLLFHNTHFAVTPIKGNLWPNKTTEISIIFSPKEIGEFEAIVYLDIDGIPERVPLKMVGTSLPPLIQLNLETLNMDRAYINKTYNYEIVAINKGHINGVIVYKETPTLFGSIITCSPTMHCLRPGDKEIFIISFRNSNQGPYFEELNFFIRDTNVVLKLYLKGEVIYPSLSFSLPCLDFGMVSVGVSKTLELDVINESVVEVKGSVKISSDGPEESSITLSDCAASASGYLRIEPPQWPREFNIQPRKVEIEPESRISLQVTLTANLVRANQTSLELELEKSDSPPIVLPVLFNAQVPEITPAPDINLRACFVDYAYKKEINVTSNDYWGYFTIEEPEEDSTLHVDVKMKSGMIAPNSKLSLPVTIKTSVFGVQEFTVRMHLFGQSKPVDICNVSGCGVRPIVTVTPMSLQWGQVKVLVRSQKSLTVCNDSPVRVNFRASLLNRDGRWTILPSEGFVEPESETDLTLSLYLLDAESCTNKAVIQFEKVKDIYVPLTATGVGTSIVVGELRDKIVLGRHFTRIPLNCKVIVENFGTRLHSLEWSEHIKPPKVKPTNPAFFNLDPRVFKLAASEKIELTITGMSNKVATVKESWYLTGSVEGVNKKESLMECPIIAEFVDPKIEVSSQVIQFQYDYGPYSEFYKLTDILTIKNVSKLPLHLDINVRPPFAIVQKQGTYKILPEEENLCCCITYNESDLNIDNIISEAGPHQSKIFIDYLTLKPVEPLRPGKLAFFQDIHKIKMAFHLTHSVDELLEDEEVMKLQILFDTTKHTTLKSKIYSDVMRLKFKGHKNKDAVKLTGKVNFPNMFVITPKVDFQCILNGSIESKTIKIQNVTPLLVCYKLQWKKCFISKVEMPEIPKIDYRMSFVSQAKLPQEIEPSGIALTEIMASPHESEVDKVLEAGDNNAINEALSLIQDVTGSIVIKDSEDDLRTMKIKILKKIAPMIRKETNSGFPWAHKFSKPFKHYKTDINEVFQLTPHRGLLKPNDIQYIHVIFRPNDNISVKALLEFEVLGGPSEIVTVVGQSSDLMYKINTMKLNFKIRSFHQKATEQLIISNIAQLPFEYKTYLNEPKFDNELQGTIIELNPPEKLLEPEEEAEMQVVMRPGIVGFYHRQFLLEIGHLPHLPIEVFGWGVIPQVYLCLQRPDLSKLDPEIGYKAIATLSLEYLEAINEMFTKKSSEHLNSPLIEKCFEDPEFQQEWHICSSWDGYPSTMDIELAIERNLVVQHITQRPEILTIYSTTTKTMPIPGFHTSPYLIDYGVVITGSTVQCIAEVVNYGPILTKLHFVKGTSAPPWLNFKLCGKLHPGESGKLEVTFTPTSEDFTELEQTFEMNFNVEVPYGVVMPIKVKALCAVPYLTSNVGTVDFGSVRCGDKIIISIPLRNVGKPSCIWFVTLKLKVPGPSPMTVLDNSGKYEPGEGGWLSIAFKPTMEMSYEGHLIFRFHMNPTKMIIPVIGHGILPHVHIIGANLNFPPTLPWSETTDMYFGLTNPCPFPIEVILAHTDEKWNEEDEIYQLLNKYYNKPDEMLVPAIKPGTGVPEAIYSFYAKFRENVKRALDEETAATKLSTTRALSQSKKTKSPKISTKSKDTKEVSAPRKYRSEAEIIADEIRNLKESGEDPLKECMNAVEAKSTESDIDKHHKGLLLFVHGSPCEEMQCQEMAYSLGKKLDLPTINIDLAIVEALQTTSCSAQNVILSAVNELFDISKKCKETSDDEEFTEDFYQENEDEFENIWKKIDYLASSKNIGTPKSKASATRKKENPSASSHSALAAMGSTTLFHMELVEELLTDYFNQEKFHRGFILDTLTSIIIKNPPLVLMTVLKCKHSIRNIHLVLCHSDFSKWAQAYEEAQREGELAEENPPKIYDTAEIDDIIESFEQMDADEYENACPELKAIYIAHGLETRRQKRLEKFGVHSEIITKKEKYVKDSTIMTNLHSESKKKIKKDDAKGKPTNEYLNMNTRYTEYVKNTYDHLINIANNWIVEECDLGFPLFSLNGQIVGSSQKKAKKKSEIQLQSSEIIFEDRGFPLTLIMCPCKQYTEGLVNFLGSSPIVQKALKVEEEFDVLQCPVGKKEYTVLLPKSMPVITHESSLKWRYLDETPIRKCECNQITDLNLLDDSTQDNVLNILSKWHCTCGKKVTSSQTSTSGIPSTSVEKMVVEEEETRYPQPLRKVKSIPDFDRGRLVLQPGDLVRCKYSFSPHEEGNFSVKRYIEVYGWPESRLDIVVNGLCDLPRLDNRPKKMFRNFVRRTAADKVYKITYLDDLEMFEFGPIFVGNNRIYQEDYTIELKNSSLMTADVEIEFLELTNVFEIDKTFMRLESGERGKLMISAAPAVVGVHTSELLFCVKDNPEVIKITFTCTGIVPIVEILPINKIIDYGKLLLYRREDDRFIVKNDSILPILWKVRNAEEFVEDFIIAQTSGIVARNDNQVVPVTYIACNVGTISQKNLLIDIYDELGRGDPMTVDTLMLYAECYDVQVECAQENPSETFINYGNVKVNSTVYREMFLINRGKYNIYYKLKKVKNFPEPTLLKSFEAIPEYGVIPASLKLTAIEFECTPTTSMNLANVPAYTCSLLDGSKDQVVVAKFPVCITIASFYNTFTLFPLGELNFNIIAVGSGVMRDVILNNTSKCPFTYEIIVPKHFRVDPNAPSPMKGKDTKIKNPPLNCGNFLIVNEDNLVAPGTSRTIPIQFLATGARKFEETIHFMISDTCPAEANGVPLKLVGTGALPTLDFWNLETTFREHLIVKNLSTYKLPESAPHCVFVEDTVTLHFFSVNVNSSYVGYIDLYNNGLVPSVLTMKLHYQSNTNAEHFSLDKYDTFIEPLLHKRLGIIFSPRALQEYRAVLELRLKLLHNEEQSFKLCLIGEGVIPRIRLIYPSIRQHKLAVLNFPMTCLGSISNKVIRFKNISTVKSTVVLTIVQSLYEQRPVFTVNATTKSEHMVLSNDDSIKTSIKVILKPEEIAGLNIAYNPLKKGRTSCDVKIDILDNPYEYFTVLCEAEAFMEDVVLVGLEMLSMDFDIDAYKADALGTMSSNSTTDTRKKSRSAPIDKKKLKEVKKAKKSSNASMKQSDTNSPDQSLLKYTLDFGGCELSTLHKRSFIMANNSDKVYKFTWGESEFLVIKPSVGYISPAEEKDVEIMFFSTNPVVLRKETLNCTVVSVNDDMLTMDLKGATWDNRQTLTVFNHNREVDVNERQETVMDEKTIPPSEDFEAIINMMIFYSATTEYTQYKSTLKEQTCLPDTFIYQTRSFNFKVENVGNVPMKVIWNFVIDEEYPSRMDKQFNIADQESNQSVAGDESITNDSEMPRNVSQTIPENKGTISKETLFSGSTERESVDTWFELNLPFTIEPAKECLKPRESRFFKVTFSPLEAFDFKVKLKSSIDNLDPYDQNMSCMIAARSLVPYVHLDVEKSDYISSGRRVETGIKLPEHITVLEFNVLGEGCYKKTFNVINPTEEGYEFVFESIVSKSGHVPFHCNLLKGFVEGGTSTPVTFSFAPTAPGVYESQWKFIITCYNLVINMLVVGIVREPLVSFDPNILIITNAVVGFTTTSVVKLKNNENESLNFEFKGDSLCKESGETPVAVRPEHGVLKPQSNIAITVHYTPIEDGPLSFKIFCSVQYLTKLLTLCVNAMSTSIMPEITYNVNSVKHLLDSDCVTNIHLDQTASKYERNIPFIIANRGSASFFYEWHYTSTPVKKYLSVAVEPKSGHITPGQETECVLFFALKQVPVQAYPVTLNISDGPEYTIYLHAEIEKPLYHFTCTRFDFGKCIINAPDRTYKKNIGFTNDDKDPIILDLTTPNLPELYVDFRQEPTIQPKHRSKITIYFRPKEVKEYEFQLQFWVNSLCEEIVHIRGEGVPLLLDLYEGCQKSFFLGPVKVGEQIIRDIAVMNHSKVAVDATFIFKDLYTIGTAAEDDTESQGTSICLKPSASNIQAKDPGPSRVKLVKKYKKELKDKVVEQDLKNALCSLKVVPSKCIIWPHTKVPLKIHFKPIGMISSLNVQLNAKVLTIEKPLVLLTGSATGMNFCFSQDSVQFGRVRRRGCKMLKVMLMNKGDFDSRFCWQPLKSEEFKISPMQGHIAARTNVTFNITFQPMNYNSFIKIWASCNILNYKPLELSMYATCIDVGVPQTKTLYLECCVREMKTEYVILTNPCSADRRTAMLLNIHASESVLGPAGFLRILLDTKRKIPDNCESDSPTQGSVQLITSDDKWLVGSEVTGASFETLREFTVLPNRTFEIPIHFKPKTIGKHEGQVLFSPLGESALFVTLIGAALHPNPNGNITITVPAKESHCELLPVYNITENPESYAVVTELVKVIPDKFEGYYEIKQPDTVKVWGEAAATARWVFICFEPCEMIFKVMFINEVTREYQFYNVAVTVTVSPIIGVLTFVSRARESVQQEVVVSNPLAEDAEYHIHCDKLQCSENLKIARHSKTKLMMTYSPLVVGESEDFLTITNQLAGTSMYKIIAKCLPAKEKDVEYSTALGSCIPIRFRVQNKTDLKADFVATVNHASLTTDREHSLGPYEKGKFLAWFEPTQLGVQNCKISFNSAVAGEFVFNMKGTATDPKPQGPLEIKSGLSTVIRFKNVFEDTRTFRIYVDREEFYVKTVYEQIKSKKDIRVVVYLSERSAATRGTAEMPTGCLTIETYEPAEPKVHWTYFLQGIP